MQPDSPQPLVGAVIASDNEAVSDQITATNNSAGVIVEAKTEASETSDQFKADHETVRLEALKAFEAAKTGVSDAMKLLDQSFDALLKASKPEPMAAEPVPLAENVGIPVIVPAGSEAQTALNAAMIGSSADAVTAAPLTPEVTTLPSPDINSEVPVAALAVEAPPTSAV